METSPSNIAPLPPTELSGTPDYPAVPESFLRRIRHALFFVSLGVLAHDAFDRPTAVPIPDGQHSSVEELSPKERRYREKLNALLQELTERWPGALQGMTAKKGGSVSAELAQRKATPEGIYQEKNGEAALTLSFDRTGAVTHIFEKQRGKTMELWPQHKDLRTTFSHNDRTEYSWWTAADGLYGMRSADDSLKSLFIEGEGIIDPSLPPAILTQKLHSPHRIFLFQRIFTTYQDHTFTDGTTFDSSLFAKFFHNFRLSLAEWQKGQYANGSCNTYAETACEVLSASTRAHYPMYILTYWPSDEKKRLADPWHQTAAYPMTNGEWCIVDGEGGHLTYVPSPDIYGKEREWELATTPVLGRFPWKAEHRGPAFRFLQHIHVPEGKGK